MESMSCGLRVNPLYRIVKVGQAVTHAPQTVVANVAAAFANLKPLISALLRFFFFLFSLHHSEYIDIYIGSTIN